MNSEVAMGRRMNQAERFNVSFPTAAPGQRVAAVAAGVTIGATSA
jgi:hypothetical protein